MQRQSLLLIEPGQLEWIPEDLPPLQPHEVLIQTTSGAISIGSELPIYSGTARSSEPAHYPRMTGYESVGVVIACGSAIQRLQVGNRVVAFYGHRTHSIVPEAKAIAVPGDVSDALALLAILSCDVTKGIRKVAPKPEEPALITGAGAVGLLTTSMLKAYGVQTIDVIEPRPERCEMALQLGASTALSPQEMASRSNNYPVAFECSSRNLAFELLQGKMQHTGRICILSDGNIEPFVLTPAFHEKELKIVGSSDGWDYQEHARWFFNHLREHPSNLEQLFDYQTTADKLIATFELLATGEIVPIKVLVKVSGHSTLLHI